MQSIKNNLKPLTSNITSYRLPHSSELDHIKDVSSSRKKKNKVTVQKLRAKLMIAYIIRNKKNNIIFFTYFITKSQPPDQICMTISHYALKVTILITQFIKDKQKFGTKLGMIRIIKSSCFVLTLLLYIFNKSMASLSTH